MFALEDTNKENKKLLKK